ncbi:O-succinylhomoserine sulfhydrylase [Micromonospora sp. D93]|uniref:O-succinylhomoserine sulfhydrylase n=1 Tax=Micromonospora sp. D93 TaxID=2824886 RepID=UPI001B35C09C|nr:O-succinylhomoserine sulfhydrylase [Micromonospora sp. D93]MBQ1017622.1 O-succinylhomoserine sulfhydrylase [Micromonospora sp. D93]
MNRVKDWRQYRNATRAVRAGQYQDVGDQHSEALALTSSYVFDDAEDAAEKFAGTRSGNVYIRFTNPTTLAFEQRIAAMEGAEDAASVASGMAGYLAVAMALLQAGDHVILGAGMFGTTTRLFESYLRKFQVDVSVAGVVDLADWRALVRPNTKMFVVESPTNPIMQVADIRGLALLAAESGALLAVDNTLCTPVYQNPIDLGADLVLHSAAKYIDGQGRCGGGVVAGRADLIAEVRGVLRTMGPSLSPFNAWVFLKGLETLRIRMREHSLNAQIVAEWLAVHPDVEQVFYTGLTNHPQTELVAKQQSGHGGLVSFTVRGGQERAWALVDRLELISNTTNIGDTKSMITHPATTTHGRLSCAQKLASGIFGNLLRISVGLEDVQDIIADLDGALQHSTGEAGR